MNGNTLRASAFAATALAFASFGDAFLYPFLPLSHSMVGVPVLWIGALLSVNRFVRILSNTFMARLFSNYGLRFIFIVAVTGAIISTAGYGLASGVIVWFVCRILWGLSFSAMRIGTLGYALHNSKTGFALGVSRSLQEAGPMVSLLLAPLLLKTFQPSQIFFLLAAMSLPALWFAFALPKREQKIPFEKVNFIRIPSTLNLLTLLSAILIDGIIVIVLGVLLLRYKSDISLIQATSLAALFLGYRRVCLVVLSTAGGWVADKVGLDTVFKISLLFMIAGLALLLTGWVSTGVVVVFSFYSINSAITPAKLSGGNGSSLVAAAENATWRDLGAATGTLAGGLLINAAYLDDVLLISTIALVALFMVHVKVGRRTLNSPFYGSI